MTFTTHGPFATERWLHDRCPEFRDRLPSKYELGKLAMPDSLLYDENAKHKQVPGSLPVLDYRLGL